MKKAVTIKEGSDSVFLYIEDEKIIIKLKAPADMEHAEEVKRFLQKHLEAIEFDEDEMPPGIFVG